MTSTKKRKEITKSKRTGKPKRGRQGEGGGNKFIVFGENEIKEIRTLASVLTKQQLSHYLGVDDDTFREIEKRQPEVAREYKIGKSKAIAGVASNLISQARNGNVSAAMFYLKTQAGWKEDKEIQVQHTLQSELKDIADKLPD
jgi:hypothetical protein